jgi:hypothetical protein
VIATGRTSYPITTSVNYTAQRYKCQTPIGYNAGMKFRPRFSLRTLFALVTLAGVLAAWVSYQLDWIRQRHEFVSQYQDNDDSKGNVFVFGGEQRPDEFRFGGGELLIFVTHPPPWSLRIFGEKEELFWLWPPRSEVERCRDLFPEYAEEIARWVAQSDATNRR